MVEGKDLLEMAQKEQSYLNYMQEGSKNFFQHFLHFDILRQIRESKDYDALIRYGILQHKALKEKAALEHSRAGYLKLFKYLELQYHFGMSNPIFPNYVLLPPYLFLVRNKHLGKFYNFPGNREKLFEAGIL